MKKYLDLILLGVAAFFSLLVFVWMALPGLKETLFDTTTNVYNLLDEGAGMVIAFVFMILVFLVSACLCAAALLGKLDKVPFAHFIALGTALFALVAMILFFLTESIVNGGNTSEYIKLGAGAVLCAISGLVAACGLCCFGVSKLLKK